MLARNHGIRWCVALALGAAVVAAPGPRSLAAQEAGETFRDCEACPLMVVVPPGSFTMGSPSDEEGRTQLEAPQREVTIGAPLAVGVYEVTFEEWDACVDAGGCGGHTPGDEGWGRGRLPVINVNWEDAQTYVRWLSQESGQSYRLLSDAEWEYVARAGTTTPRFWPGEPEHCRHANGRDQDLARTNEGRAWMAEYDQMEPAQCSDGHVRTAPVGSYPANAFGLHDVLGNVNEWTHDCWNESHADAPADGSVRTTGDCSSRALRGGSWLGAVRTLRSAFRIGYPAGNRFFSIGLRVARSVE